jgi:predicted extracellular nuclease
MLSRGTWGAAFVLCVAVFAQARADMRITEWMYQGGVGEFVEFTNVGKAPVDMTGWSFDDDSRLAGSFSLSSFGTVAPGESVILTEATATDFRNSWGLGVSVKVIGGLTQNLSRNDEINLYNSSNALVDRLTFGDQNFPGTIRTQNASGNPLSLAVLGTNNVAQWTLSKVGDAYGSYTAGGAIANPGLFTLYQVPEPSSLALLAIGLVGALAWFRRQ